MFTRTRRLTAQNRAGLKQLSWLLKIQASHSMNKRETRLRVLKGNKSEGLQKLRCFRIMVALQLRPKGENNSHT